MHLDITLFEIKLYFVFICFLLFEGREWGLVCLNEKVYKSMRCYKSQMVRRSKFY